MEKRIKIANKLEKIAGAKTFKRIFKTPKILSNLSFQSITEDSLTFNFFNGDKLQFSYKPGSLLLIEAEFQREKNLLIFPNQNNSENPAKFDEEFSIQYSREKMLKTDGFADLANANLAEATMAYFIKKLLDKPLEGITPSSSDWEWLTASGNDCRAGESLITFKFEKDSLNYASFEGIDENILFVNPDQNIQ